MKTLFQDLKFAVRALAKTPGSAAISIIALALGIGLTTTMFSLVYGVFFRGLGVPEADRLYVIWRTNPSEDISRMGVTQHDLYDWIDVQESFEGLGHFSNGTVNLSGNDGPERYDGAFVSANVFDLLRVRPLLGSTFRPGDDLPDAPLTVVLGYDVWETRFRSNPDVVGEVVKINGEAATILGVMEDGFMFPTEQELWLVRRDERAQNPRRGTGPSMRVFGRLKDGVTLERAEIEFAMITDRLAREFSESNEGIGAVFMTFAEKDTGPELLAVFSAAQVATIFVLMIACANVANLLLARATMRAKEAAVRSALGASRWRVMMPIFSEAAILSVAGAVAGIGIAFVGVGLFDAATAGVGKPYYMEFAVDPTILAFVVAITTLTAIAAGVTPAFRTSSARNLNVILQDESRGSSGARGGRLSKVLVVGEVALSCALLVGAGLMAKSIVQLRNYDFDFATTEVFSARVGLFETDYPDPKARTRFFVGLKERLEELSGVESVALATSLPALGSGSTRFAVEGATYPDDQDYPRAFVATISPDFFRSFDVDLTRGRDFSVLDDRDALPVTIVNQDFADTFFPRQDPLGRRFRRGEGDSEADWLTIVGIAPNLLMEGLVAADAQPAGFYLPMAQQDIRFATMLVRTAGSSPLVIAPDVRRAVATLDSELPIYNVVSVAGAIEDATWFYDVFGTLFIVFGAAALFLASVGLYGVLSFSVSRRTREIGVRMALGAESGGVLRLVLKQGLIQVAIGLTIGMAMAYGLSNVVAFLMFQVDPRDPSVFGAVAAMIILVGTLASFIPAWRATTVAPMDALRSE